MELVVDGTLDFVGGQDASKIPDSVPENAVYQAINVSNKRGAVQPRSGFEKQNIDFEDTHVTDSVKRVFSIQEIFETGKFQGVAPYLIGRDRYLLFVISGYIFLWNQNSRRMFLIPISDGSIINPRASRINITPAGRYTVIFDFPNYPVIVDGATARRADPAKLEIPVSAIGSYNQNRLFIGNIGEDFTAGDPVGSLATPDAPITFKEVLTPGTDYYGQIFKLPTTTLANPITAMGMLQVTDTSTGIGPLLVGTEDAIYAYGSNQPRANWAGTSASPAGGPFGSVLVQGNGIVGPRGFANVNSDMFFMSGDGHIRSLAMSRDEQKRWARVPISREVEPWLKFWDKSLAQFGFVTAFNNKVFFSANPYRMAVRDFTSGYKISDYAHGGIVVLEFDNVVAMGQASNPTWAGLWTGIKPMDMVTSGDRCFAIAKDGFLNRIYEVTPETTYDMSDGKIRYIRSRFYTREYTFKDPFQNKEAHSLDFNIDEIHGDFKLEVNYKAAHSHGFHKWRDLTHCSPWRTCCVPDGPFINGYAHQYIREFTLGSPDEEQCDPATGEKYTLFRKVQFQCTITGAYWEVHELKAKAVPRLRNETESICEPFPCVAEPEPCNDDWYVGDFDECRTT